MYNANTTDNQEEVYDVVNEKDEVIGKAKRREVHTNKSLIHRAVGAYIFNTKGEILLQKRSKTKDTYPSCWMLSVGGHVDTGMDYIATIHREIQEELGVDMPLLVGEKELVFDETETEYWMTFIGVHDGPFPNFNTVEADEVKFFDVKEVLLLVDNHKITCVPHFKKNMLKALSYIESGKVGRIVDGKEKEQYV